MHTISDCITSRNAAVGGRMWVQLTSCGWGMAGSSFVHICTCGMLLMHMTDWHATVLLYYQYTFLCVSVAMQAAWFCMQLTRAYKVYRRVETSSVH